MDASRLTYVALFVFGFSFCYSANTLKASGKSGESLDFSFSEWLREEELLMHNFKEPQTTCVRPYHITFSCILLNGIGLALGNDCVGWY